MDIYSYAMQMEKDGENYYRELADNMKNAGIRNILIMLADAEVVHYRMFQHMKNHEALPVVNLGYLSNIKNVFAELSERKRSITNGTQTALYQKAQKLEEKTRDFYREKAGDVDQTQKEIFLKIANEEQKHYDILENLIIMVSRRDNWLENPEWYHLEEY